MRYILGVVGFIILAIISVVLLTTVINDRSTDQQVGEERIELTEYADQSAEFSYTVQGPIVGHEEFRSIRIIVSPTSRTVQVLNTYDDNVERQQTYANTQSAYAVFVQALEQAGFSRERDSNEESYVGVCPTGNRSLYRIKQADQQVLELWSANCRQTPGNFGGNKALVEDVFQNQIPDYRDFAKGVNL